MDRVVDVGDPSTDVSVTISNLSVTGGRLSGGTTELSKEEGSEPGRGHGDLADAGSRPGGRGSGSRLDQPGRRGRDLRDQLIHGVARRQHRQREPRGQRWGDLRVDRQRAHPSQHHLRQRGGHRRRDRELRAVRGVRFHPGEELAHDRRLRGRAAGGERIDGAGRELDDRRQRGCADLGDVGIAGRIGFVPQHDREGVLRHGGGRHPERRQPRVRDVMRVRDAAHGPSARGVGRPGRPGRDDGPAPGQPGDRCRPFGAVRPVQRDRSAWGAPQGVVRRRSLRIRHVPGHGGQPRGDGRTRRDAGWARLGVVLSCSPATT